MKDKNWVWLVFARYFHCGKDVPKIFSTRQKARDYLNENFINGYVVKYMVE